MKLSINYKGNILTRNVNVYINKNGYITGSVGQARVYWDKKKYADPIAHFKKGKLYTAAERNLFNDICKRFIDEYFFVVSGKSPMTFEESKNLELAVASNDMKFDEVAPSTHASGVPLWMKDEHKVWTECFKADGSSYMRRTRYKKESKETVEKYLPHCSACPFRVNCAKPCKDPSSVSNRKESTTV